MTGWDRARVWIQTAEGGHTVDSGGDTWFGVAHRFHPAEHPWPPSRDRALELLKAEYWDTLHCDRLPSALALAAFDAAVNHGQVWAALKLQLVLGLSADQCDGKVGPVTIEAAGRALTQETLVLYLAHRALWYATDPSNIRLGLMARLFRLQQFIARADQ